MLVQHALNVTHRWRSVRKRIALCVKDGKIHRSFSLLNLPPFIQHPMVHSSRMIASSMKRIRKSKGGVRFGCLRQEMNSRFVFFSTVAVIFCKCPQVEIVSCKLRVILSLRAFDLGLLYLRDKGANDAFDKFVLQEKISGSDPSKCSPQICDALV